MPNNIEEIVLTINSFNDELLSFIRSNAFKLWLNLHMSVRRLLKQKVS